MRVDRGNVRPVHVALTLLGAFFDLFADVRLGLGLGLELGLELGLGLLRDVRHGRSPAAQMRDIRDPCPDMAPQQPSIVAVLDLELLIPGYTPHVVTATSLERTVWNEVRVCGQ